MKTRAAVRFPEREPPVLKDSCTPAKSVTTSELHGRNAMPGSPVSASMSGSLVCNQGGTVEYFVSHP